MYNIKKELIVPKKPPLGLKPKWLHDEERKEEVINAIKRYLKSGRKIPNKWIKEYNSFCK